MIYTNCVLNGINKNVEDLKNANIYTSSLSRGSQYWIPLEREVCQMHGNVTYT
jgi:hypothetical protein